MKTPDPSILKAVAETQLPSPIGFGQVMSPVMAECHYSGDRWSEPSLVAYGPLTMMPSCKVLHYGQEIFEGMKAYCVDKKGPFLFCPRQNLARFNRSAERMAMPPIPDEFFMDAVEGIVRHSAPLIPSKTGESLYIRPFMFATEESLGIAPPKEFAFLVVAAPCGNYFGGEAVKIWIERKRARAFPGGVGTAKTGGNYAAALKSTVEAQSKGFHQILWLDGLTHTKVEEFSGMNFFCVVDGVLLTPALTDTILDGITRKALIGIARHAGMDVREETVEIDRLLALIGQKRCTEAFSCGTAVTITPIASFHDEGGDYPLAESFGPIAQELRHTLLGIQEGRLPDPGGMVHKVGPS